MKVLFEKDNFVYDENLIEKISLECGVLKDTARLLVHRKIDTVEKAKLFLNPDKKRLYNPFLLTGMDKAVEIVKEAKNKNQTVLIFGDYDADGICASTVLYLALTKFGIKTHAVIPERDDGYGLNVSIIEKIREKINIDLVITVDCGISDGAKIKALMDSGLNVVVTDHHEPPEVLPDCVCINPKIKNQKYPFTGLCGAGVAYKLAYALMGKEVDEYLDFVALATVADSMDLIDENRIIVYEGLKLFNSNKIRSCFKYCLSENTKNITSQTFAFSLAPRINAGGRMGDANSVLNLFLEDNEEEKFNLAVRLKTYNMQRQVECDEIYNEARRIILEKKLYKDSALLVYNEKWKTGVVAIVAARLVEDFSRPAIVFAGHDGFLKGSARSVDGINIYDAVASAKDLLIEFGGHSQAAGVSLDKKNFSAFKKKFLTFLSERLEKVPKEKIIKAEWEVTDKISERFAKEIEMLEPFGVSNKRPLFAVTVNGVKSTPIKLDSLHCSFSTPVIDMMDFNGLKDVELLNAPIKKQLVFETNYSVFKNKEYVKGYLENIIPDFSDTDSTDLLIFEKQLDNILTNDFDCSLSVLSENENNSVATCYVASNFSSITEKYKSLPTFLFYKDDRRRNDCVIVCPREIPEGYDRIIYLDNPLSKINFNGEAYLLKDGKNIKFIDGLSVDRNDFVIIFKRLLNYVGKNFEYSKKDIYKDKNINKSQFIFVSKVFFELGIFYLENGILEYNTTIESKLTNSKIYNRVCLVKGSVC